MRHPSKKEQSNEICRSSAHHSFTAEYDSTKVRQFNGTVTKVEWTNPHARFYLDVKDERGAVTNWNFELGTPLLLRKLGWRADSLKIGDQVTVEGYLAKDGAKMANARSLTLADYSHFAILEAVRTVPLRAPWMEMVSPLLNSSSRIGSEPS